MSKAYVFLGLDARFFGMCKVLYESDVINNSFCL